MLRSYLPGMPNPTGTYRVVEDHYRYGTSIRTLTGVQALNYRPGNGWVILSVTPVQG